MKDLVKERMKFLDFIKWLYDYIPYLGHINIDKEQVVKIKNILTATNDMLNNFNSINNNGITEFEMTFQSFLNHFENGIMQSNEKELIGAIKHFLMIEYNYEIENRLLLPYPNSKAFFGIIMLLKSYNHRYYFGPCPYKKHSFNILYMNLDRRSMEFSFNALDRGYDFDASNNRYTFNVVDDGRRIRKIVSATVLNQEVSIMFKHTPKHSFERSFIRTFLYEELLLKYSNLTIDIDILTNKIKLFLLVH